MVSLVGVAVAAVCVCRTVQECGSYLLSDSLARWVVSGLRVLSWTNALEARTSDGTLEGGRGADPKSFNRGGKVLSVRNVENKVDNYVKFNEGVLVVLSVSIAVLVVVGVHLLGGGS